MLGPDVAVRPVALAAKFLAALQDVSWRNPASWWRISAIGARTGISGAHLERIVYDNVAAGLVEQHVDDDSLVMLTSKGWAFAGTNQRT